MIIFSRNKFLRDFLVRANALASIPLERQDLARNAFAAQTCKFKVVHILIISIKNIFYFHLCRKIIRCNSSGFLQISYLTVGPIIWSILWNRIWKSPRPWVAQENIKRVNFISRSMNKKFKIIRIIKIIRITRDCSKKS